MDAGGTRLPTPGAFTGKFQEILEGADSWSEVADKLQGQTITYFDFETTGISDYDGQDVFNDPVQLGAVQVKDGKIVKRFNMYVNPESRLSDWSANNLKRDVLDENGDIVLDENGKPTTTLVTPEWLAQQPSQKEALDAFIEFIGPDALLGGQNVPFDVEILKRMADKYETPLSIAGTIDSKDLASLLPKYDPEKGIDGPKAPDRKTGEVRASSSLGPVANFLGFEPANWHSADGDAEDSYNLVSKLINRAAEENNSNLGLLDFDAMQERYNERMAEFKQVVSADSPITEAQEAALGSMAESANPKVAELAREALANKSTRGAAAEALSRLHALENANLPTPETSNIDKTSSSSGRKYNLSNIQWTAKPEDVVKKTNNTPTTDNSSLDSWPELEEFQTELFKYYESVDAYRREQGVESTQKLRASRLKYQLAIQEGDQEKADAAKLQYIAALEEIMDRHARRFDRNNFASSYSYNRYTPIPYKPDGILTNLDVAKLMSKYRKLENDPDNTRRAPADLNTVARQIRNKENWLLRALPQIDPSVVDSMEGNWKVAGERRMLEVLSLNIELAKAQMLSMSYGSYDLTRAEMDFITESARLTAYRLLGTNSRLAAFRDIVDDRGNVIRIFNDPRSSTKPVATNRDIVISSKAFAKIRERIGSDKKPVTLSLVAPSTQLPSGRDAQTGDSSTIGFAFKGGDAHALLKRIENARMQPGEYDPETSHHSVPYGTYEEKLSHVIIHEYAHVMMYKYWAGDTPSPLVNGSGPLENDYQTYKVAGQKISKYGSESVSEHFAEAFARYIATGDATPEFLNLLRSKGLLKSQQEG